MHNQRPDRYYHCRVKLRGSKKVRDYAVVNDLSWTDIEHQIIKPWLARKSFTVAGTVVTNCDAVEEIQVAQTDQPQEYYATMHNNKKRAMGIIDFATDRRLLPFDEGTDLTNELLFSEDYKVSDINSAVIKLTREGVFFSGQQFDALKFFSDIFLIATESISIIDNYVDESILNLLTGKLEKIIVCILTNKKGCNSRFVELAKAFKKQYGCLSIRTTDAFYDRFVIIDDKDFYHVGASIKDLGNKGFMFSKIEEPVVIEAIRTNFVNEWNKAVVVI